jgi:hypothetical protein
MKRIRIEILSTMWVLEIPTLHFIEINLSRLRLLANCRESSDIITIVADHTRWLLLVKNYIRFTFWHIRSNSLSLMELKTSGWRARVWENYHMIRRCAISPSRRNKINALWQTICDVNYYNYCRVCVHFAKV